MYVKGDELCYERLGAGYILRSINKNTNLGAIINSSAPRTMTIMEIQLRYGRPLSPLEALAYLF